MLFSQLPNLSQNKKATGLIKIAMTIVVSDSIPVAELTVVYTREMRVWPYELTFVRRVSHIFSFEGPKIEKMVNNRLNFQFTLRQHPVKGLKSAVFKILC